MIRFSILRKERKWVTLGWPVLFVKVTKKLHAKNMLRNSFISMSGGTSQVHVSPEDLPVICGHMAKILNVYSSRSDEGQQADTSDGIEGDFNLYDVASRVMILLMGENASGEMVGASRQIWAMVFQISQCIYQHHRLVISKGNQGIITVNGTVKGAPGGTIKEMMSGVVRLYREFRNVPDDELFDKNGDCSYNNTHDDYHNFPAYLNDHLSKLSYM